MGERGFDGLFGRQCTILFFIILFLLLFWEPFFGFGAGPGVAVVKE